MAIATVATRALPDEEILYLNELYITNIQVFRARLHQLYSAGHRPTEIYHAVQKFAGSSATRKWCTTPNAFFTQAAPDHPVPAPFYPATTTTYRISRAYRQIPASEQPEFIRLAQLTRQLRGKTPEDSPLRGAKNAFDRLVHHYYVSGVRISDIARVAGVTHRAIAHRL